MFPARPKFRSPFLIVLNLAFFAVSLAAQSSLSISNDRIEAVAGRGLQVRTKPSGATVYVDGIDRGKTPLALRNLPSGEYAVRIVKTGYREREMWVRISHGSRLELDIELEELAGRLFINVRGEDGALARPFHPEILIDGELPTGVFLISDIQISSVHRAYELRLPIGYRQLRVRAFGWEESSSSLLIEAGKTTALNFVLRPAAFALSRERISRPRFNPHNSGALGTTVFSFQVSAPGSGVFSVSDQDNRLVYTKELSDFTTWSQQAAWDGRDAAGEILEDGIYTLRLETYPQGAASGPTSASAQVVIDSSLQVYPLTLFAAMPGLFYAPSPAALPPGSFQLEGSILFGQIPGIPFELGFRFSPFSKLELSAAYDMVSLAEGESPWGFALSAKWIFRDPPPQEAFPLGLALLANFSWSTGMEQSPQPKGVNLIAPLSWDFGHGLSFLVSPGLFWPKWNDPSPRLLLALGPRYRHSLFSAGISLRSEFDFSPDAPPVTLFTAAELKFYPPPSNLVFTLIGGFWNQGSRLGGFGGAALGAIF